jgi:hypothetical protein
MATRYHLADLNFENRDEKCTTSPPLDRRLVSSGELVPASSFATDDDDDDRNDGRLSSVAAAGGFGASSRRRPRSRIDVGVSSAFGFGSGHPLEEANAMGGWMGIGRLKGKTIRTVTVA